LSTPRATILIASSGNGRYCALASSHGAHPDLAFLVVCQQDDRHGFGTVRQQHSATSSESSRPDAGREWVLGTSPASTRSTFMTNDDAIAAAESAEQRIDHATDAIRGMSRDLAEEVAPHSAWLDQVSAATRAAPIQSLAIAFLIGVILARR
jgi:hypothetical protein